MRDVLTVAELTFRETRRQRVIWLAFGLGAAFISLYALGFYFIHRDMVRYLRGPEIYTSGGFSFVVLAALYGVSFLGIMLAALLAISSLSAEIGSHAIESLAVKPIRRGQLLLGKWLGLAFTILVYIAFLSAGVVLATYLISGYLLPKALPGALLIGLQSLIMLSIAMAAGARVSIIPNGVIAFMSFGLAFVGGWIEQFGAAMGNQAAVDIGIVTSLLVPTDAVWRYAAYMLQPAVVHALGLNPFSQGSPPSTTMLVYAVLYAAAMLLLASRLFGTRDL